MKINRIIVGDCLKALRRLKDESIDCVITSPPYWGLRDYGVVGQLGHEKTPEEYVANLVDVFAEVRRVLKPEGTVWLNLGDCYASNRKGGSQGKNGQRKDRRFTASTQPKMGDGLKDKDLVGMPWMVAFALRADGWYLRQEIIWAKPNTMPESVRDRCTRAHEQIFMLTKSAKYHYDIDAIREPHIYAHDKRNDGKRHTYADNAKHNQKDPNRQRTKTDAVSFHPLGRNKRTVWTISTRPFKGAHFATFPEKLIEPMLLAGCPRGGVVLDPFIGSGTTAIAARRHGRQWLGIELNWDYAMLAEKRIADTPI